MDNNKIQGRAKSMRKSTVRMVENHLAQQRNAYDQWIQELCRDAEESAAERDRLQLKLSKLREEQKRKTMIKILSRMSNMVYYRAWSCWYNVTVRIHQMSVEEEIKLLRAEVEEARKVVVEVEAEAQARADEAARIMMASASGEQRALILKIMTKLVQGLARVAFSTWSEKVHGQRRQKMLITKILKRLQSMTISKGWTHWKLVTTKWALIDKLAKKDALVKKLQELDRLAKEYEADATQRKEDATAAQIARCSGDQKALLIKILAKMCGNFTIIGWSKWKMKVELFNRQYNLVYKIISRCLGGKKHAGFRTWHSVTHAAGVDKYKIREELLKQQRDSLLDILKERAAQLEKLQAEAAELLVLSERNAQDTANVMTVSDRFADNVMLIIDKKALDPPVEEESKNTMDYAAFEAML